MKQVIQCDFDGTITIGEVSRLLLETFAQGDWSGILEQYKAGKITVQDCNVWQFAMVRTDKDTMRDFLLNSGKVVIRPGFENLLNFSRDCEMDFVITSNGQRFYIETILNNMGIDDIEIFAAQCEFSPDGMKLTYPGPKGNHLADGFKEAWAIELKNRGYDRIYYAGNGASDIFPAQHATHVFAIDGLLERCRDENISCIPFNDLYDIVNGIKEINS